jgi:(heptosyl)LPS beta-1,4-glucosyltransferase
MLTVLIPCKNERRNIEPCVASARLLGGEILVADSGSTDGTLDLVRGMSDCRLVERVFINYADFNNLGDPPSRRAMGFRA